MKIGIDASNIIDGGGVTHLIELLKTVDLDKNGINKIIVWASRNTLDKLPDRRNIELVGDKLLEKTLLHRLVWQKRKISKINCDVDILFVPGGIYFGDFKPFVTMSRSLLPFDGETRKVYGTGLTQLKLSIVEKAQKYTFNRSDGIIFLTEKARLLTEKRIGRINARYLSINHGVADYFFHKPKEQSNISDYNNSNPYKLLYVSPIVLYKNQWKVIQAVARLRDRGLPLELHLIGGMGGRYAKKLFEEAIRKYDPNNVFVRYHGKIPYERLKDYYIESDAFIFASSCETFGQVLVEAMASGLPIACSNRTAMPEVLGDAGIYFTIDDINNVESVIHNLIVSKELRTRLSFLAFQRAKRYMWSITVEKTFDFISNVYMNYKLSHDH